MATISALAVIFIPLIGFMLSKYLDRVDASITVTSHLQTDIAVMSRDIQEVKKDISEVNTAIKMHSELEKIEQPK